MSTSNPSYGIFDFTLDESVDAQPDKYVLTIAKLEFDENDQVTDGEEIAVIVHRATTEHPIDGALAESKRANAQRIVDTLNANRTHGVLHPTSIRDEIEYHIGENPQEDRIGDFSDDEGAQLLALEDEEIDLALRMCLDDFFWDVHDAIRCEAIENMLAIVRERNLTKAAS